MSPHRDPQTGQFVSSKELDQFDSIEQVHATSAYRVAAAAVGGQTGADFGQETEFEGVPLYSLEDQVIDRGEVAALLWAHHRIVAYITSTQTADGTIRGAIEISSSPERQTVFELGPGMDDIGDQTGDFTVQSEELVDDTADVIGPALEAVGFGPITDGTNGVGGSGNAGTQDWEGAPMVSPIFDDRDDMFVNGAIEHSNVADAALHVDAQVWHVYGRIED